MLESVENTGNSGSADANPYEFFPIHSVVDTDEEDAGGLEHIEEVLKDKVAFVELVALGQNLI